VAGEWGKKAFLCGQKKENVKLRLQLQSWNQGEEENQQRGKVIEPDVLLFEGGEMIAI